MSGAHNIGMLYIPVVTLLALVERPLGGYFWWQSESVRHTRFLGSQLLMDVFCIADCIWPPNQLMFLVYINILGILWLHNKLAGRQFGSTIQALPQRNTPCILGDFNCSLPPVNRLVGIPKFRSSSGRQSGSQHGEMSLFSCLLSDLQLIALNSWSPQHGATFIPHAGESRIDFILTRHRDADNLAKQIGVLEAAPFLPTGAHHVAMMTSLNYKFYRP